MQIKELSCSISSPHVTIDFDYEKYKEEILKYLEEENISTTQEDRQDLAIKLHDTSGGSWERFYQNNQSNFFKNRNYLTAEFELIDQLFQKYEADSLAEQVESISISEESKQISSDTDNIVTSSDEPSSVAVVEDLSKFKLVHLLEIGSGTGNTVFPLLKIFNIDKEYKFTRLFVNACDLSKTAIKLIQR